MDTFRGCVLASIVLASLGLGACATSGAVPRPFPSPDWDAAKAPDETGPAGSPAPEVRHPAESPSPVPDATNVPPPSLTSPRYDGRAVAEFALGFRGVPYRIGGADPTGFDCSGLVQYVFAQYGIAVPRLVEQQFGIGDTIKPSNIKPGDLLFFNTKGPGASHVAIAIGNERFVHAPTSTGVVRVEGLSSTYWGSRYMGARRITSATATN
jgi:cell wall-associated NlpC family hydrolase